MNKIWLKSALTTRWRQSFSVFLAPADWMNIHGGDVTPVVVGIFPAIEVDEDVVGHHVVDGGGTDQVTVLLVH